MDMTAESGQELRQRGLKTASAVRQLAIVQNSSFQSFRAWPPL